MANTTTCSCANANTTNGSSNKQRRLILDCDAGTDDAIALYQLLLAEAAGKVKIEMIVCTRGNTTLKNVCRNVVRVLEYAKRTDIPVYRGSHETLLPKSDEEEFFHGVDGFGDLSHANEPNLAVIRPEFAVHAMQMLINQNPNEISIFCIGPLTNLALLMRMCEDVTMNIKDIHIMGGNHLGQGNLTSAAEFNFSSDPEAAHIVFSCAKCPVNLLTWECCTQTAMTMKWRMETLGTGGGPTWELIDRAEKSIYKNMSRSIWMPCDAFLISAFLHPEIIIQQQMRHIEIELNGKHTRGQVAIDHLKQKQTNTNIIEKIDDKLFQKIIVEDYTKL